MKRQGERLFPLNRSEVQSSRVQPVLASLLTASAAQADLASGCPLFDAVIPVSGVIQSARIIIDGPEKLEKCSVVITVLDGGITTTKEVPVVASGPMELSDFGHLSAGARLTVSGVWPADVDRVAMGALFVLDAVYYQKEQINES
jgi:hypothetical protein